MLSQTPSNSLRNLLILYFLVSGLILSGTGMMVIGSLPHLGFEFRVEWFRSVEVLAYKAGDAATLESLESAARTFESHVDRIAEKTFWGAVVMIGFGGLHLALVAALVFGRGPSAGGAGEGDQQAEHVVGGNGG